MKNRKSMKKQSNRSRKNLKRNNSKNIGGHLLSKSAKIVPISTPRRIEKTRSPVDLELNDINNIDDDDTYNNNEPQYISKKKSTPTPTPKGRYNNKGTFTKPKTQKQPLTN